MKKYLNLFICLTLMFTFTTGLIGVGVTNANAQSLADEIGKIQGSQSQLDQAGGTGAKEKIRGLSKDGMDIVGIIVMAILVISGMWTAVKFAGAGDNAQSKTVLKASLIMHILGIIFLANYFGFIQFAFEKLKIF